MFNNECHNCTFNDESSYYNKMIREMKMLMQEKEKEKKEKMKDIYIKTNDIIKEAKHDYELILLHLNKEIESKKNSLSQIKQIQTSKIKERINFYKRDTIKIEKSISIKEHEYNNIKNLLFSFQPFLLNDISNNVSLSQSEIELRSQILDINSSDKNTLAQIQKETGICSVCIAQSESIVKCNSCNKTLCPTCRTKCNDFYYCSNCFSICSLCGMRSCNKSIKRCFNPNCSNIFCPSCYKKNQ